MMGRMWWGILILFLLVSCAGSRTTVEPAGKAEGPAHYYLLSQVERYAGRPREAIAFLDRALGEDPRAAHLWLRKAELEASQGDLQGALEDARTALDLDPENHQALILMGKIFQSQGRRKEAISFYRKALVQRPTDEEVTLLSLEAAVGEKDYATALDLLEAWIRREPDDLQPHFYKASLYQSLMKDEKKAVATYRRILALDPINLRAVSSLAGIYLEGGKDGEAMRLLRSVQEKIATDTEVQLKLALIYYEVKRYDQAIEIFQEILKREPDSNRVIYYLGVIYENVDKPEEGMREFAKIPPRSEFYRDARLHMAYLYQRQKRAAEAVRILKEGLDQKPEEAGLYEFLGEIYSKDDRYEEAVKVLREGLEKVANKESLHYSLGLVHDRAGRYGEGIRQMRSVLKLNPNNANALNYIGYTYAEQNRKDKLDEALLLIQKALLLKPNDGYITDSLGWVYFRKGDLDQAFLYIQKAYDLVPGEPTITEHLGDVFLGMRDKEKALRYLEESLADLEKKEEDVEEIRRLKEKIERVRNL